MSTEVFIILVSLIFLILFLGIVLFAIQEMIEKKIDRELKKFFDSISNKRWKKMLKYTIEKAEAQPTLRIYPYFGKSDSGLIVLFTERETGIVFGESVDSPHRLGHHSADWIEVSFKPMNVQEIVFKVL